MTTHPKSLIALALVSTVLTACGGGGDGGGGGTGSFSSTSANAAVLPAVDTAGNAPQLVAVTDIAAGSTGIVATAAVDSDPSIQPGVLTVSEATLPGIDGVYGAPGAGASTEVYLQAAIGVQPELCAFRFTTAAPNAVPAPGTPTAVGKITYMPSAMALNFSFLTFNGKEYATGDAVDTIVDREHNLVRFTSKTLTATDGSNHTIKLNATIPLNPIRNAKC